MENCIFAIVQSLLGLIIGIAMMIILLYSAWDDQRLLLYCISHKVPQYLISYYRVADISCACTKSMAVAADISSASIVQSCNPTSYFFFY